MRLLPQHHGPLALQMLGQVVHKVRRPEDGKGHATLLKRLFDAPFGLIIQRGRTDLCSDKHPGNVRQASEVLLRGQFHDAHHPKMLHLLDIFGVRARLEAEMRSYASTERLLHHLVIFDTSLNILEAGAELGCCAFRIAYQEPHLIAIVTQLSGDWRPNGAGSSNDQYGLLIHCFPPLLFRFSLQ